MHLVDFIIRICHDARSSERQNVIFVFGSDGLVQNSVVFVLSTVRNCLVL